MPESALCATTVIAGRYSSPEVNEVHLVIGGVLTSVKVAIEAREILQEAPGMMVRQPLARYRNPLSLCDYHAEAAPYRDGFHRKLVFTGRGAAGRPATKHAFMHALQVRADDAMRQAPMIAAMPLTAEAYAAMACDVSYVMAMSRMAVSLMAKQHQWRLRSELRQAQQAAVGQCQARAGEFTCDSESACGTGSCRFASGIYRTLQTPAGKGRCARPANHQGDPFSPESVLPELEKLIPFKLPVP